jgi:two-component system cell cycle sensor histidine kinase/response regulator CckA
MDDEEMLRSVVSRMLEIMGYDVVSAADGEEAVRLYIEASEKGTRFDAVILDLSVQRGMGGREAAEKLVAFDPEVIALVSSGFVGDPVLRNYHEFGFRGVIPKPYTSDELREGLSRALVPKVAS